MVVVVVVVSLFSLPEVVIVSDFGFGFGVLTADLGLRLPRRLLCGVNGVAVFRNETAFLFRACGISSS